MTVKSDAASKAVYLTTQQNYITMRPGQTKSVCVELIGEQIFDSSDINWENVDSNGVITIIGKGETIQVYANKEGLSHLKAKYKNSDSELDIYIEVNSYTKDVKYITTRQNVIECTVSKTMDFFTVNLIGGSKDENQYFECSVDNKDIVSVICDGNTVYYRGLKAGQALLNISNDRSNAANILQVRILVEDNNIDYGIKPDKNTLYLEKNGASKSINIESYGDINIDESLLDWFIYSGSDVIDITYSGSRCVIKPKKDGFARIRCTYPKLKLYCNIGVYVGQNVEFCFSDNNVIVEEEDCKFIELKLPDSFENPGEYITFESLDPNVCSVFGTGRVCCVEGIGKGSCIIRAVNSFDGSVCEAGVTVKEKELNKYKLSVSKNTYVLNPRSSDQRLKAYITGKGLNETENEDIEWEIASDTSKSLSLYPNKGSEVLLKLNTITDPSSPYFGRVGCGEALIKVRHPCLGDDYKTIYVVINELDNFFTLDKYSANVNVGSTVEFTCTILNAKISDYDDVTWNVAGFNTDKYGNKVEVGRLLSKKGRTCTLYGLNDGICTVTAYYYGNVVQCEVNVNADRVFRINGATSVKMFPDVRDDNYIDVSYILRPSSNVPLWSVQNIDKPSDVTVLSVEEVTGEQKIRLRPNGVEGRCSVSGFAVGIGQVSINVDVRFDPELRLNEEVKNVLIKMEEGGENEKEFTFYSYPAIYYVGVNKSGPYSDYVSVYIDKSELIGDYLQGKVHVKVNKEFPVNGCIVTLQQYTSSSLSDSSQVNSQNSKLSFSVSGYYEDSGFYLGYTKGRGNFINLGKTYNVNNNFIDDNNNTYYKFYDTNMKNSEIKPLELADCEKHYFVLKNRHANSFMKDLKVNIISEEAQLEIIDPDLLKLINNNDTYRENIETFSQQNFPKVSKLESKSDGSFVFDIDTGNEGTDYGIDWNIMENKNIDVKKSHYFNSNKIKLKNLYFRGVQSGKLLNLKDCIFEEKVTERYTIKYFYHTSEQIVYVYSSLFHNQFLHYLY
ncbi:MAG: hypothetical protein K6E97_02040, partial [Treponema sp.]|nr:hypothetical protein [Treponema sp.]